MAASTTTEPPHMAAYSDIMVADEHFVVHILDNLTAWRVDEFYTTLGHFKFILEGYSLEVVQARRKESRCWRRYEHFVDDVKSFLNIYVHSVGG